MAKRISKKGECERYHGLEPLLNTEGYPEDNRGGYYVVSSSQGGVNPQMQENGGYSQAHNSHQTHSHEQDQNQSGHLVESLIKTYIEEGPSAYNSQKVRIHSSHKSPVREGKNPTIDNGGMI